MTLCERLYLWLKYKFMSESNLSLYTISDNLMRILDDIETYESSNESVPAELYNQLEVQKTELQSKMMSYIQAIKALKNNVEACKVETDRIKTLKKRCEKRVELLKENMKNAVLAFGKEGKNEKKMLDIDLNTVSVSRSKAVVLDTKLIDDIQRAVCLFIQNYTATHTTEEYITSMDTVIPEMLDYVNERVNKDRSEEAKVEITYDTLSTIKVKYTACMTLEELSTYGMFVELLKSNMGTVEANTSITDAKEFNNLGLDIIFAKQSEDYVLSIK